jgi:hypothetical protein
MQLGTKFIGAALLPLLLVVAEARTIAADGPKVAVIRSAAWSPGDMTREGASEMLVLMEIARLQPKGGQAGLVAVGDRRGIFSSGAEEALHDAVLRGVPVVKLASGGRVLPAPHGLFLDGGSLSAEDAARVLAHCLTRYGSLPSATIAGAASPEIQERLRLFQNEFTLAASTRLAVR